MKTKYSLIAFLILLVGTVGAIDIYNFGVNNGHYYDNSFMYSMHYLYGGYLPTTASDYFILENDTIYYYNRANLAELIAYDLRANITLWNITVPNYYPDRYLEMKKSGNYIELYNGFNYSTVDALDGDVISEEISPYYYNSVRVYDGNKYVGFPIYNNNTHMTYFVTGGTGYVTHHVSHNINPVYYNGSDWIVQASLNLNDLYTAFYYGDDNALYNRPIYDSSRNLIIQTGYSGTCGYYENPCGLPNRTSVVKEALNIPATFIDKECWTNTCGSAGSSGYFMNCSKSGGNESNSCDTDIDCSAPTAHCNYIESEGSKKCTNDDSPGVCQINLMNPCYIDTPYGSIIDQSYDSDTGEIYLAVYTPNNISIFTADIDSCLFSVQSNITPSLLGVYPTLTSTIDGGFLLDKDNIYFTTNNGTYEFNKIRRSNGYLVYTRELARQLYNGTMPGYAAPLYMEYDTTKGAILMLVDNGNQFIVFENLNFTTCPSEDVHVADPYCYTNNTLDLVNHQYCDTSVNPTEIQPCVPKILEHLTCNRDWQCVFGPTVQGYCNRYPDFPSGCEATDSPLGYNCSCGQLSWNTASTPANGFWFYQLTHGNESSLFDSYSVSTNLDTVIYNQSQTILNISLNDSFYYRVSAVDNLANIYWVTDILPGSAGTTSTTVTTTTIVTTSTTIPANCYIHANFNVYSVTGAVLANSTVNSVFCHDVPSYYPYDVSPFCSAGILCAHGNMLSYYNTHGLASSCEVMQSCVTNAGGQCNMCLSYSNNASYADEYCIGLVCIPVRPDEVTFSSLPNEMVFSANGEGYQESSIYVSILADSQHFSNKNLSYNIYMTSYNYSKQSIYIHVYNKETNVSISGALARVNTATGGVLQTLTNANGTALFDIPSGSIYSLTVSVQKGGYYPYSGSSIFNLGFGDLHIEVPLDPYESNITFNVSGSVSNNATSAPIKSCLMTLSCKHYLNQIPGMLGPSIDVTKYTTTNINGSYSFIDAVWNQSECSIYTSCSGYNNQQYDLSGIDSNIVYNFSLIATGEQNRQITGFIFDGSTCTTDVYMIEHCLEVPSASVLISSNDRTYSYRTSTDTGGYFEVNNFPRGNITITVTKTGYETYTETRRLDTNIQNWIIKITPSVSLKWLRGRCVEIDANGGEIPVNCTVKISNSMGQQISEIQSSATQIGYFSMRVNAGMYTLTGRYKLHEQTQSYYILQDTNFDDIVFRFSSSYATASQKIEDFIDFATQLFDFMKIILILLILAVMSILLTTITTGGMTYSYIRRKRGR